MVAYVARSRDGLLSPFRRWSYSRRARMERCQAFVVVTRRWKSLAPLRTHSGILCRDCFHRHGVWHCRSCYRRSRDCVQACILVAGVIGNGELLPNAPSPRQLPACSINSMKHGCNRYSRLHTCVLHVSVKGTKKAMNLPARNLVKVNSPYSALETSSHTRC